MAAGCAAGVEAARAEVQWQEKRILLEPPAGAANAKGEFVFTNRGSAPVRVVEARSSCECTVMARDDAVVYPGEKGRLPVVFHLEGRQGRQSVGVVVTTSEPEIRHHELTVEVEIKEFATVTPRLIFWKVGDDATARIFQVSLREGFRFLSAESATPNFSVEVVVRTEAAVQLRVVPQDTWARRNGRIKINVAQEGKAPVELSLPVRVI